MTQRHMKIFSEVCRLGSITLAAEAMNMVQPAVSYAVRELEGYYGIRLFERMNRRLYITEAGEQLLLYADSILTQFDEARDVLRDIDTVSKIRIGTQCFIWNQRFSRSAYGIYQKISGYSAIYSGSEFQPDRRTIIEK